MNEYLAEFDKWLGAVCEIKSQMKRGVLEPQDIFERIDLKDAKLSFIDGISDVEYADSLKL